MLGREGMTKLREKKRDRAEKKSWKGGRGTLQERGPGEGRGV